MDATLEEFVEKARKEHWSDEKIQMKLVEAGWAAEAVHDVLGGRQELAVPVPPTAGAADEPAGVTRAPLVEKGKVKLLSADEQRMKSLVFEYHMMFLTMWLNIVAAFWTINGLLFSSDDLSLIKFPVTALVVCLPVFAVLMLRTKGYERATPDIRRVNDRLHLIQATQSLTFVFLLIHTIFLVFQLIDGRHSLGQQFTSWLCSLIIFGGIFSYYWRDTHTLPQA